MHGARVCGFDLSPVGLDVARAMAEANDVSHLCDCRIANISELPYEDEEFDLVLHNAVLHHILKYPNVRTETLRVLKPGGRVVFADGLRDNPLYTGARAVKDFVRGKQAELGDIDLEMQDILDLSEGFVDLRFERRCLFESVKAVIAKPHGSGHSYVGSCT